MTLDPTKAKAEIDALVTAAARETGDAVAAQKIADQVTIDGLHKDVEDRDAIIAALQNALPPVPKPTFLSTLFGINIGTDKGVLGARRKTYAPLNSARFYWSQKGKGVKATCRFPTGADLGDTLGKTVLVTSYKLWPQDVNAGMYDAELSQIGKDAPTDVDSYHALWHEMEDDVEKGHFTLQELHDAQARFARLVRSSGNPRVKIAVILMGFTFTSKSRNPEDFIPTDPTAWDIVTTDTYFEPLAAGQIGRSISTLVPQYTAQAAFAAKHGKKWGVTEIGIGHKLVGEARKAALKLAAQTIVKLGGVLGQYFIMGGVGDPEWGLTPDEWAAWVEGQKG